MKKILLSRIPYKNSFRIQRLIGDITEDLSSITGMNVYIETCGVERVYRLSADNISIGDIQIEDNSKNVKKYTIYNNNIKFINNINRKFNIMDVRDYLDSLYGRQIVY